MSTLIFHLQSSFHKLNALHHKFFEFEPLGVYVKKFDAQVDNSYKNGYEATLGEFAGRFCRIAPLRSTLREAVKDCFEFMKAHNDRRLLKVRLSEQYFVQNLATSIF